MTAIRTFIGFSVMLNKLTQYLVSRYITLLRKVPTHIVSPQEARRTILDWIEYEIMNLDFTRFAQETPYTMEALRESDEDPESQDEFEVYTRALFHIFSTFWAEANKLQTNSFVRRDPNRVFIGFVSDVIARIRASKK